MPTLSVPLSRAATRGLWRAEWAETDLTSSERRFLSCLSRFITHGGRIEWSGIGSLIRQFSADSGRSYTQRHVLRLLAWAARLGLIRRARHSAPGRPAMYEAVIPGHPGHRHVKVRRRGIRPRRLLASWRAEQRPSCWCGAPEEGCAQWCRCACHSAASGPRDTPAPYRDRPRSGAPPGA